MRIHDADGVQRPPPRDSAPGAADGAPANNVTAAPSGSPERRDFRYVIRLLALGPRTSPSAPYREREILGRMLTPEDVQHFTDTGRLIARP